MSSPSTRILLIGNEGHLLRDRVRRLAAIGAQVVVSDPSEIETHVGLESFDVVLLCHTLSALQRRVVTESAHRRWPRAQVLHATSEMDVRFIGSMLNGQMPDDPEIIAQDAAYSGRSGVLS